ncbi:MAG: hypothetical protein R3C14_42840 [Caldilineaceae bacterium]
MKLLVILASFMIVLIFLVILATVLERYWRNYQQARAAKENENKEQTSTPSGANPIAASVAQWSAQLRTMMQPAPPDTTLVKQFHAWVTRDLGNESELQRWLLALPEAGFAMLTEHIAAFCQEMNFDLTWLVDEQTLTASELKTAIRAVVVDYCRACQKAVPAQKHAKLFAEYQRLLKNPAGKQERSFSRTLYANLASQGLTPTPNVADLINAGENERQQQALQAIQQAAAKDWPQFAQVLQATIAPNGAAGTPQNGRSHHDHPSNNGKAVQAAK